MPKYVIIDNRLRSEENRLLTPDSIVGSVETASRKKALEGYSDHHSAILESQIQSKGDRRLREKLSEVKKNVD